MMWEHYSDGEYYNRVGDVSLWVIRSGKFWKWMFSHDTDPLIAGSSFRTKLSLTDAKDECLTAVEKLLQPTF